METKVVIEPGMVYGTINSYWGCRFLDGLSWFNFGLKQSNHSMQHIECLDRIINQLNEIGTYQYPEEGSEEAKLTFTAMHIYMLLLAKLV
jgi:hypothetical protein